ncbi:hypothetical protein C0389_06555 [bacterium]|nr:hypothetical protein [bacterium]
MENDNKDHWYDGWFYDKFIAPNQDKSFSQLKDFIEKDSTLLDVGCGTGRLAFRIADKCKNIVGIDLSMRNIAVAKKNLLRNPASNIEFRHANIESMLAKNFAEFDYSVLSYVIHEVAKGERNELLNSLLKISPKIILVDYLIPRPNSLWSLLNEIVELIAGKEHYKNFRTYVDGDGILGLAEQNGLIIHKEIKNYPATSHLVVLTKKQ